MHPDSVTELIAAARSAAIRFRQMMWLTEARKLEEAIAKVALERAAAERGEEA